MSGDDNFDQVECGEITLFVISSHSTNFLLALCATPRYNNQCACSEAGCVPAMKRKIATLFDSLRAAPEGSVGTDETERASRAMGTYAEQMS